MQEKERNIKLFALLRSFDVEFWWNRTQKGQYQRMRARINPVNKGMLCSKGKEPYYVATGIPAIRKFLYPEMRWRRNHPLQRVFHRDSGL